MTDASQATAPAGQPAASRGGPFLTGLVDLLKQGDIALAVGVISIIVVLIMPMPAIALDMLLAISIVFSVLILMTTLFIRTPLEFSAFPTILLIAAMMRLALNLASTRLILSNGHLGTNAAGNVIEAFGNFVMQGNFVIGIIVFAILIIVNFIVITKGSGRIAEVAARFTLDAMPGKQMAIDADLSAGLIDEEKARSRRKTLEDESAFFGAMDGASKFVRGDAIAGLLITFINIVAGIIIGIGQQQMSLGDAASNYTLLTVGDGLVSQIPALIVSTAAGLLVSKAGVSVSANQALAEQFSEYPRALGMTAAVMAIMALLPGMPSLPFLALAAGAGYLAYRFSKQKGRRIDDERARETAEKISTETEAQKDAPITDVLKMDELKLELGYALLSLVKEDGGSSDRLTEQIKALRRQLAMDMGVIMPSVRILDNMQLQPNEYKVRIKEVDSGKGEVYPDQYMVMDPQGGQIDLPGQHTIEPTFGLPATWIDSALREEAEVKGFTIVDPSSVISTHLTEILKSNVADILTYANVQQLLNNLPDEQQKLVDDIVPSQISISGIQRVLQILLSERVSIRDLATILEGIAEVAGSVPSAKQIAEHVRTRLSRQLCAANATVDGSLPILTLSPDWERDFSEALHGENAERHLAMAPSRLHEFIQEVQAAFENAAQMGELPVVITSPQIRPHVRSIVERFRPQTVVMSQTEIHPRVRLKTIGNI